MNRDYDVESTRQKSVEEFYRINHINQTYDFVSTICNDISFKILKQNLSMLYLFVQIKLILIEL